MIGASMAMRAPRANPIQRAINILKSAGPGAWYDPSDLTTLFQDSAGTTPVTAVEQPVGLMLDKSQGLVLGSELCTDPSFDSPGAWSAGSGIAVTGGNVVYSSPAHGTNLANTAAAFAAGKTYLVQITVSSYTSGRITVQLNRTTGTVIGDAKIATGTGTFSTIITTTTSGTGLGLQADSFTAGACAMTISSVTVKELPGNHLIQPTATSRPTLSSRVNLTTYTEDYTNAAWTKVGTTVTANAIAAPDGTTTADLIVETAATSAHYFSNEVALFTAVSGTSYTQTIYAKYHSKTYIQLTFGATKFGVQYGVFNIQTGAVASQSNGTATITDVGGGWYRCSFTATATAGGLEAGYYGLVNTTGTRLESYLGNITIGIYVWGASLTTAADASLPYQRVNTATDYDFDFSKFPAYLKFDGVDDSLYSAASIDFTSTDKMTVFAGVHKASDAAVVMLLELSASADSNAGGFYFVGTSSAATPWQLQTGPVGARTFASYATGAAPRTSVLTSGFDNAAATEVSFRESGVVKTAGPLSVEGGGAVGNFGNHVLYIGRRNNALFPFSGRIYQLAIKGKSLSAAEISTVESFVNSKTKAFV